VRHRIDGVLRETRRLPQALFAQSISRIKLLAGMDIADRRTPQDGRYQIDWNGRSVDARVSSIPTIDGERLVIRLLDMQTEVPSLERLGMPDAILRRYRELIHAPHGFVVICGPTGSGKTTTLYASLAERHVDGQHLCTVEDPVEVRLPGVSQVQVNPRAGMSFASALRAFLRQDPNAIMVGELRDTETANVAMSAALSGQLVLTSMHSSSAPLAVERLIELGVARHAIAAGLSAIISQRLVRRSCDACAANGCERCAGEGYVGRTGIFELVPVTADIREAIAAGAPSVHLAELASRCGYEPMSVDAWRHVTAGRTTVDELRRLLGTFAA
jgi:type II secretory ATPase GspE/PulE/Tfp pilus assembly ATPase PilB-like protein